MKLTVIESEHQKAGCKHELGRVYRCSSHYYLLAEDISQYHFVNLDRNFIGQTVYNTIEEIDEVNPDDILVNAEIIIREVK